jgi:hypothetical protein
MGATSSLPLSCYPFGFSGRLLGLTFHPHMCVDQVIDRSPFLVYAFGSQGGGPISPFEARLNRPHFVRSPHTSGRRWDLFAQ